MLGTLGQAFDQAPKPDAYKLHKLDEVKKTAYPLETDELKMKFQRRRDEEFYESIQVVRDRLIHSPTNSNPNFFS